MGFFHSFFGKTNAICTIPKWVHPAIFSGQDLRGIACVGISNWALDAVP
jgi:hypothetical protein